MPSGDDVEDHQLLVEQVAGFAGGWAFARVTFRAYSWQLFFRPWTSAIGLFVPLFGLAVGAVWWRAFSAMTPLQLVAGVVTVYAGSAVFIAAMTAAAVGSAPLVRRGQGRRTAYLLKAARGRACVLIDGIDSDRWELSALAAWPRRAGLGSALGRAVIQRADADGADLALWCTHTLEPLYADWGFETVRRRLGMRRMRRAASGEDSPLGPRDHQ